MAILVAAPPVMQVSSCLCPSRLKKRTSEAPLFKSLRTVLAPKTPVSPVIGTVLDDLASIVPATLL
ncbi:hypothetical protein, partial [Microbacterium sp.]|uniref:hypothetical protein n=1 Tax=Microbacterium sp. TaxID=51671 RepID=UPI002734D58F